MGTFRNITGQTFGKLTALKAVKNNKGSYDWLCKCECGSERVIIGSNLTTGKSKSCGCSSRTIARKSNLSQLSHGLTNSPEYVAYYGMLSRCLNPNTARYPEYGGRGITICDRWIESFEAFYADMGPRPSEDHSLDRRENDGHYEVGNCRWATRTEQQNNTRYNVRHEVNGKSSTIAELSKEHNMSHARIRSRLNYGWSIDRILSTKDKTSRIPKQYLHKGESKSLPEWSDITGIRYGTLYRYVNDQKLTICEAIARWNITVKPI